MHQCMCMSRVSGVAYICMHMRIYVESLYTCREHMSCCECVECLPLQCMDIFRVLCAYVCIRVYISSVYICLLHHLMYMSRA